MLFYFYALGCLTSVIHCTACNRQIGVTANQTAYAHPVLMVLICKASHPAIFSFYCIEAISC